VVYIRGEYRLNWLVILRLASFAGRRTYAVVAGPRALLGKFQFVRESLPFFKEMGVIGFSLIKFL